MRPILAAAFAAALPFWAGPALAEVPPNPLIESQAWDDIRFDVVGEATILPAEGTFELDAPPRAQDAATVPVTIRQPAGAEPVDAVTLVIDENPAPVVATIHFSEAMQPLDFELRVRVNQYSNVRAIAETPSGLRMTGRYVKASGGCSAPATRAPEEALARMGEMRVRGFGPAEPAISGGQREAQVMIRHPNYSGLQRDQLTQLFVPAHFIDRLEVRQGDELLFELDGGISISENPVFRFRYTDNGAPSLSVRATDTEGNVFQQELPKAGGA